MLLLHDGVHDAALDDALLHRGTDRSCGTHLIDRAHMLGVTALGRCALRIHAQCRTEDGGFDVMDRDGVAGQQCADETMLDEPGHVRTRAAMDECRPGDPDHIAVLLPLIDEELRQLLIVDRLLATDFGRHELELVAVGHRTKGACMHEQSVAAVLVPPDGDALTAPHAAAFADPEGVAVVEHRARHPSAARGAGATAR